MPILHNYIQKHSHIIHQIQFAQPHYVTHRARDSFSPCFWLPSNWIYVAEISSPGVKNMGGTMEWLSGLGGLRHMQFFHTLLPVLLLSARLAHLAIMGNSSKGGRVGEGQGESEGEGKGAVWVRARARARARARVRVRVRAR